MNRYCIFEICTVRYLCSTYLIYKQTWKESKKSNLDFTGLICTHVEDCLYEKTCKSKKLQKYR